MKSVPFLQDTKFSITVFTCNKQVAFLNYCHVVSQSSPPASCILNVLNKILTRRTEIALPSAEKMPRLPCSQAAWPGPDGEDKTQCSSRRLLSRQFCPQCHVEQHQWCRDIGIDPKWNNLLSWEFVYRLGVTAEIILLASFFPQRVCLRSQPWIPKAEASQTLWRCAGKDEVGLWRCRHPCRHHSRQWTLSQANACGCAPAPVLLAGSLLGGDPFARMHWISSGTRSFLCTLSGGKVHAPESIKALCRACVVPATVLVARLEAKPVATEESLPCRLPTAWSA